MTELLANLPFDPIDYDPQPFAVFTEEALRRGTAAPRMQLIVKQTGSHTCGRHLRHRDVFLLPGLGGVLWSWVSWLEDFVHRGMSYWLGWLATCRVQNPAATVPPRS